MSDLSQLRDRLLMSQGDVAMFTQMSKATISKLETTGIYPKTGAQVLRCRLLAFFTKHGVDLAEAEKAIPSIPDPATAADPPTFSMEKDMLLRSEQPTQAALTHFKLFRQPFVEDITETKDVFLTPDSRRCREALWSVARSGGFTAIVGESGSGKSTLAEELEDRLKKAGERVIIIRPYIVAMEANDRIGKTMKSGQLCDAIIRSIAPTVRIRCTPDAHFKQLHDTLIQSRNAGHQHLLLIEEAHSLPIATLKQLKRFREIKDGLKPLLGVLLIGQTELGINLSERNPEVREVVQRCEVVQLEPLGKHLEAYIEFKLKRVGGDAAKVLDPKAYDAIRKRLTYTRQGGEARGSAISIAYPLAVNNLLARAMNIAFSTGSKLISAEIIGEC